MTNTDIKVWKYKNINDKTMVSNKTFVLFVDHLQKKNTAENILSPQKTPADRMSCFSHADVADISEHVPVIVNISQCLSAFSPLPNERQSQQEKRCKVFLFSCRSPVTLAGMYKNSKDNTYILKLYP